MGSFDINMRYNIENNKIELVFKSNYEEVTSSVFVSKKPEVTYVWRAINSMSMERNSEFIDKFYESYKYGVDVMDLLVWYSKECIKNISVEARSLCEDALVYGMKYNGIRLLEDKQENFIYYIAEAIWHIIELESDTWYNPPKHTKSKESAFSIPGLDALNALFAASACMFNEKAEEIYSKNSKMNIMIQDRYYW